MPQPLLPAHGSLQQAGPWPVPHGSTSQTPGCVRITRGLKMQITGNSLVVQWLGLRASTAGLQGTWVRPLVGELRSCMLCGVAKKQTKKQTGSWALSDSH